MGALFGAPVLGKHDFLKLLVTQVRYQNPLEPLKDTEFVAQLAQFSTLESMQNVDERVGIMTELIAAGQASSGMSMGLELIGKTVSGTGADGSAFSGSVTAFRLADGALKLVVDGVERDLSEVELVESGEAVSSS